MPTQILNYETPLACFLKAYPHNQSISSLPLRVFGCTIVHIHNNHRNKHDLKTRKCLFLGYSPTQKGYKCYSLETRKYYTSMHVKFIENQPFFIENFPKGKKVRKEENIWDTIAPIFALPHESEHPQTPSVKPTMT